MTLDFRVFVNTLNGNVCVYHGPEMCRCLWFGDGLVCDCPADDHTTLSVVSISNLIGMWREVTSW